MDNKLETIEKSVVALHQLLERASAWKDSIH